MGPDSSCFSILLMVLEPVLNKFGTKTVSELVLKTFGHKKVSEPVSKQIGYQKSLWIDLRKLLVPIKNLVIRKIWSWSRDFLVSLLSHLTFTNNIPFCILSSYICLTIFRVRILVLVGHSSRSHSVSGTFLDGIGSVSKKLVLEKVFERDFEKIWYRKSLGIEIVSVLWPLCWSIPSSDVNLCIEAKLVPALPPFCCSYIICQLASKVSLDHKTPTSPYCKRSVSEKVMTWKNSKFYVFSFDLKVLCVRLIRTRSEDSTNLCRSAECHTFYLAKVGFPPHLR